MTTGRQRINTQVPRRTKVQPATPMASEWDVSSGGPPSGLRTPADKMNTATGKGQASFTERSEPDEKFATEPQS